MDFVKKLQPNAKQTNLETIELELQKNKILRGRSVLRYFRQSISRKNNRDTPVVDGNFLSHI